MSVNRFMKKFGQSIITLMQTAFMNGLKSAVNALPVPRFTGISRFCLSRVSSKNQRETAKEIFTKERALKVIMTIWFVLAAEKLLNFIAMSWNKFRSNCLANTNLNWYFTTTGFLGIVKNASHKLGVMYRCNKRLQKLN